MTREKKDETTTEWMQALLEEPEDLLAEVVRIGLEALMEGERDAYVGAGRYERTDSRRTMRNGWDCAPKFDPIGGSVYATLVGPEALRFEISERGPIAHA